MFRFVQGVIIGSLVTIIVFYNMVDKWPYHEHEHKQIEQPMPKDLEVVENSIIIFYNPTEKEHKKLHKWLSKVGIVHKHQ